MQRRRAWNGPAVLGAGFRPFFLAGSAWAGVAVAVWLPGWLGLIDLPAALPPVAWHVHELLFGYVAAVLAGFLLTAIPNWTGRLPVNGGPLAGLVFLWVAGRAGVAMAGEVGVAAGLGLALLFPVALVSLALRELLAGGAGRNLPVIGIVALYAGGQLVFAAETVAGGAPEYGHRIAIAAILVLVMLIGGRIIPSFTTTWLRRSGTARLPAPFGRIDGIALVAGAAAIGAWVAAPDSDPRVAAPLLLAGLLQIIRQLRWRPLAVAAEPLLWVLHLAHIFIPIGFVLSGLGHLAGRPELLVAATHVWAVGAVGLMTLGVMTRASRGHTGRSLSGDRGTVLLYAALVVAATSRAAASLAPDHAVPLLWTSGAAWVIAFGGFALGYAPMLLSRRL